MSACPMPTRARGALDQGWEALPHMQVSPYTAHAARRDARATRAHAHLRALEVACRSQRAQQRQVRGCPRGHPGLALLHAVLQPNRHAQLPRTAGRRDGVRVVSLLCILFGGVGGVGGARRRTARTALSKRYDRGFHVNATSACKGHLGARGTLTQGLLSCRTKRLTRGVNKTGVVCGRMIVHVQREEREWGAHAHAACTHGAASPQRRTARRPAAASARCRPAPCAAPPWARGSRRASSPRRCRA